VTAAGDRYDVVVVGGGQAGLALGHFLARDSRRFKILEAADAPAAEWRKRWDSLKLFTPVRYDSLPGLPFPGELDAYPGRDEVVEYLARYAEHFNLPVQFNSEVLAVRGADDRGFVVELRDRAYHADQVVIATGPFQRRGSRPSPSSSTRASSRCTAPTTAGWPTFPAGPCWWWAVGTRATRSPRSWRRRTRCISPSVRGRPRCRSGCSAVTCSGISKPAASCA
jgi:glycine/D-amino acid oxidase-like deaminating enzyme